MQFIEEKDNDTIELFYPDLEITVSKRVDVDDYKESTDYVDVTLTLDKDDIIDDIIDILIEEGIIDEYSDEEIEENLDELIERYMDRLRGLHVDEAREIAENNYSIDYSEPDNADELRDYYNDIED